MLSSLARSYATLVLRVFACGTVWLHVLQNVNAALYEVGPGRPYLTPNDVPWETVGAGDEIRIHWRAAPYLSKWVVCAQGTAAAPIIIRGIPSPEGALPILSGEGASTRTALNYWGQERSIIKIGGASIPTDKTPRHIIVESLEVRSARPPFAFIRANGTAGSYLANAAPIWVEKGEHITVRGCVLHDSGNGFFVSSGDALASSDILVEGCYIHSNGNVGSILEHNIYTAAVGIVYQWNRLGPLRAGCGGNNLKDRSAGLVVRTNWIEGGNRQLDLVDAEDSGLIRSHPSYAATHVYANVLVEPDGDGNRQIVHYGGDSGTTASYRKGTLHFYHNTVISKRVGKTALFRLSTSGETCEAVNNILLTTAAGAMFALMEDHGTLNLLNNWIKSGYISSHSPGYVGTITGAASFLTGADPGFADLVSAKYQLVATSPCRDAGAALHAGALAPVERQYVPHQSAQRRSPLGAPDIGAFEFAPLDAWRGDHFGTSALNDAIAGDQADPDSDGATNFAEFSALTDPLNATSMPGLSVRVDPAGVTSQPIVRFNKRAPGNGVGYLLLASHALHSWISAAHYPDGDPAIPAETPTIEHGSGVGWIEVRPTASSPPPFYTLHYIRE